MQDFKTEIKLFLLVAFVAVITAVGGILLLRLMMPAPATPAPTDERDISGWPASNADSAATAGWQTYRNEEFGFEVKYPEDQIFVPEQFQDAPILRSFSVANIEESQVYDLALYVDTIKISPAQDAQRAVQSVPNYKKAVGPDEKQINGAVVYVVTQYLYEGAEGVARYYYFPHFALTFVYANSPAEESLRDAEEKIISTFRFAEDTAIRILSPGAGTVWKMGEAHTIELSSPVKESYPFTHLTLNALNGDEIGIVYCKIGAAATLGYEETEFRWNDTKTVLSYCGAGLEGKTKEIKPGMYTVIVTKDAAGRPILAESEAFSIEN